MSDSNEIINYILDHICKNEGCGLPMVMAEWVSGDYCWGCRAVLGRNWEKPIKEKINGKGINCNNN